MWHVHDRIVFRFKKEGNLTQATTWMNLEDIMKNEISPPQKDKTQYNPTYIRFLEQSST